MGYPQSIKNYLQNSYNYYKIREPFGFKAEKKGQTYYFLWNSPDYPGLNNVVNPELTQEIIENICQETQGISVGIGTFVQPNSELENKYLIRDETARLMALNSNKKVGYKSDLSVREVKTEKNLAIWCDLCSDVFDLRKNNYLFNSRRGNLSLTQNHKYIGFSNGEPAAALDCTENKNAAGIYWVAVRPEYRKRGYGFDMVAYAVNQGIDEGINIFTLAASEMGYKMYQEIGFETTALRYDYILKN